MQAGNLVCVFLTLLMMLSLVSCRKETDEDLLIDDGGMFSSETEETEMLNAGTLSDRSETEALDGISKVPDSEVYNTWSAGTAGNSEKIFYVTSAGSVKSASTVTWLMMAADRISGTAVPMCSKPDCSHNDSSCGASLPSQLGSDVTAISVSDEYLYYAGYSDNGGTAFRRKLPDGAAEQIASIRDDSLFPGEINSTYHTNQSCFYKGDWYYAVSAGNTGDGEDRREAEHYATVARVPIDSGREAKTVIQDKVTGYDHYAMSMMPRDDGLYLVMLMYKDEILNDKELGSYLHTLGSMIFVYLINPETDSYEIVFTGEYPEGQRIQNLNLMGGKLYYETLGVEDRSTRLYVQDPASGESTLLIEKERSEFNYYDLRFIKEGILCIRWDSSDPEPAYAIEVYDYEGKKIRSFTIGKPEALKPENPDDYVIDGRLNMRTWIMGADSYYLYCMDTYTNWQTGLRFTAAYAVSLDGRRVLPFAEE